MSLSEKELALFYGAKAKVTITDGSELYEDEIDTIHTIGWNLLHELEQDGGIMEVKPILRPLSEETIDALRPKHGFSNEAYFMANDASNACIYNHAITPKETIFLVHHYVDIFRWIDQDKAINALELEQNPYE